MSNFFIVFLVQTMTPKGHFEINWPLKRNLMPLLIQTCQCNNKQRLQRRLRNKWQKCRPPRSKLLITRQKLRWSWWKANVKSIPVLSASLQHSIPKIWPGIFEVTPEKNLFRVNIAARALVVKTRWKIMNGYIQERSHMFVNCVLVSSFLSLNPYNYFFFNNYYFYLIDGTADSGSLKKHMR